MIATRAGVRRVDADGIALWGLGDRAIDVLFDGRRVWSFWLERDTRTTVPGVWSVGWPGALTKFLDGQTRLTVTEHVSGRVLFDQELSFGTATKRIEIVGRSGAPISLDKSGRISPTFDTRSAADVEPLLNAIRTVLDAIASAGIEAFVAYGTLLGAVREKRFLGHDSDADLAYVSESGNPCDVVRESFRLQRVIHERGFRTYRYSGAAFRVDVVEGDGVGARARRLRAVSSTSRRRASRLYLMGEVGADFRREWVYPTDHVHPRGAARSRPPPSPSGCWRRRTGRRGRSLTRPSSSRPPIAPCASSPAGSAVRRSTGPPGSAPTAATAASCRPASRPLWRARPAKRLADGGTVIDVGAGRGADSLWLARRGLRVQAYDYVPSAADAVRAAAADEGLDLDVRMLNLTEWRSVLAEGARLARLDGPRRDDRPTHRRRHQPVRPGVPGAVRVDGSAWRGPALPRRVDRLRAHARPAQGGAPRPGRSRADRAGCQNPGDQGAARPSGLPPLQSRTIGGPMGLKDVAGRLRPRLGQSDDLARRVEALEADVLELRRHNVRLAEIADVVQELLVPLASRDQARIDEAIEKFSKSL